MNEQVIADLRAEARRISDEAWAAPAPEMAGLAADETYYDAADDEEMRTAFYGAFELPDDPRAAYDALHALIDGHTGLGYKNAKRELYRWIDLHSDGRLRSIYSGDPVNAQEVMAADARIEAALMAAAEAHNVPLEELESAVKYNCEHVVPQGWFGKKEPMKGDLHHLFTCEVLCNQYRDNNAYFDFEQGPSRERCGHRIDPENKFEPVTGKGSVCRATLYFLVRYPGAVQNGQYDAQRIETVKRWAREDPVSDQERHRNWTIHTIQKNRNPFVDHPDWIDLIDFSAALG